MTVTSRDGRRIGLLILLHLATGLILPYVILQPVSSPAGAFLETATTMATQVRLSVLMLLVGGLIPIAVSIAVWRNVRERSDTLGRWLLVLAVVNFTLQLIENSHWMTMLSASQAHAQASVAGDEASRPLALAIYAAWKWAHYSHILIVVAWLFALYGLLFRRAMVPRGLAVAGMITSGSHFIGITLPAFGGYSMPLATLSGAPLGVVNLALALWLMAKGFKDPTALASGR